MSLLLFVLVSAGLLLAGYFTYGRFMAKVLRLNPAAQTPACALQDNVDFVPTPRFYLLGQHLSAIAAAAPIAGPIIAGMWFGWIPAIVWIVLGGVFIGAVHDMATLVASLRHQGRSIAEVIREHVNRRAYLLFLLFLWFSLMYIITVFTDMTAGAFVDAGSGGGVAASSMLYLLLALVMGATLRFVKLPLAASTLIFLPLVLVCIYVGPLMPLRLEGVGGLSERAVWDILLLGYCGVAALIPVWLLLQPRGYLGGFFLTFTAGISFIGLAVGSFTQGYLVQFPAFVGWVNPAGLPMLPILFTTIACGACSGFHAIVASGTTSKQIAREPDARLVGYGGMLLESFVAIIALATLMMLSKAQAGEFKGNAVQLYASGIASFLNCLGLNKDFALNFALLAFATFVYDTLDVATRLGRYVFQELTGWRGKAAPVAATIVTLILPLIFVTRKVVGPTGAEVPVWNIFWNAFGSSNQLLAAMVLFMASIWLYRMRMRYLVTLVPSIFMAAITVASLVLLLKPWLAGMLRDGRLKADPLGITAIVLLLLAFLLVVEGLRVLAKGRPALEGEAKAPTAEG